MREEISLIQIMDMNGLVGMEDSVNSRFVIKVRESNFATLEQNMKLKREMEETYKNYLESVKKDNNGIY